MATTSSKKPDGNHGKPSNGKKQKEVASFKITTAGPGPCGRALGKLPCRLAVDSIPTQCPAGGNYGDCSSSHPSNPNNVLQP